MNMINDQLGLEVKISSLISWINAQNELAMQSMVVNEHD
ncbi:hypothetical protein DFO73_111149 [Cytobacillus oceanisediminis]|uniref:Uncharacterized protein n=1 Tax=Cytobacillus oceanisediminis TaxID=665099 RepID=A0A2V2ZRD4_9BACI|nr:hypothetical protein DFO73_111149 [Cytobacillus oceanisediminis]